MPANHFDSITHVMIRRRLLAATGAHVDWLGSAPPRAGTWNVIVRDRLCGVRTCHVEEQLELHAIMGDGPTEEIDTAIGLAATPDGLPANAAVAVEFHQHLALV